MSKVMKAQSDTLRDETPDLQLLLALVDCKLKDVATARQHRTTTMLRRNITRALKYIIVRSPILRTDQ